MKKCKNCHKYCEDYLEVCPNCGRPADRFVGESQASFFSFEEEPVKKTTSVPKKLFMRLGVTFLAMIIVFIGFIALFLFIPDEEEEIESPRITINQDVNWKELYPTYEEMILDRAPFSYFQPLDNLIPYFEEMGWQSNIDTQVAVFSKNGIYITFAFPQEEGSACKQVRLQILRELNEETRSTLQEVVSDYVINEWFKPMSESPFGITEDLLNKIQKEGDASEYGSYKEYYIHEDDLSIGYFIAEKGDNFFFTQGLEEDTYTFDFFFDEGMHMIDVIKN